MDKSVWKKTYSSFPGVKQASTIDCELLQIFRVSKYDCVVGTIYTSTRAREHNGVCGMCGRALQRASRLLRETQRPAPESSLCGNVHES